jgi:hypothetical protein
MQQLVNATLSHALCRQCAGVALKSCLRPTNDPRHAASVIVQIIQEIAGSALRCTAMVQSIWNGAARASFREQDVHSHHHHCDSGWSRLLGCGGAAASKALLGLPRRSTQAAPHE